MEMVEVTARLCQRLGLPRSSGQIFGLLYLSTQALSLDEIAEALEISKASVSTGTRQLLGWHAIRQVWKPGDRKDYYEVQADLGELLRANYLGFFRPKLDASKRKLAVLQELLDADLKSGSLEATDYAVCKDRLESLTRLQSRIQKLLPLAEKLL
jgi:DNA-binding transcriptional regulator GbsR (MarR family)